MFEAFTVLLLSLGAVFAGYYCIRDLRIIFILPWASSMGNSDSIEFAFH